MYRGSIPNLVAKGILLSLLAIIGPLSSIAQNMCSSGICTLTWQNDTYRTGDNLNETALTYNTLGKDTFGQLCSSQVDGQVYAQPLVVTNVIISGTRYASVVYVVTENDSVYAFNGTPPTSGNTCQRLLGPVSLLNNNFAGQPTMSAVDCHNIGNMQNCPTIAPSVGVLGTPVVRLNGTSNSGTLYVVAEMQSGSSGSGFTFYHFLHALDITTLAEGIGNESAGAPIQICGGSGCFGVTSSHFSQKHIQRPGLLLANCGSGCNTNYVYVAFSMMDDTGYPYPNGVIFGYKATNLSGGTVFSVATSEGETDSSNGGGIWQGGAAPAFGTDSSGNSWIYLNTANGTWDGNSNWGDSLLKLNPNGLSVATNGYFTPADQFYRSSPTCTPNGGDVDFGSGGVTLIPDSNVVNYPYLAVSGEKEGYLWFLDRTSPGEHITTCDGSCSCGASETHVVQKYNSGVTYGFHNNLAFWQRSDIYTPDNFLYGMAFGGSALFQYTLCAAPSTPAPTTIVCSKLKATDGSGNDIDLKTSYGSTPAISAASSGSATDAIVWLTAKPDGNVPEGTVPAFDAISMRELYDSNMCSGDAISPATKFSVPTVANGNVYLGTQQVSGGSNTGAGMFYIFGALSRSC